MMELDTRLSTMTIRHLRSKDVLVPRISFPLLKPIMLILLYLAFNLVSKGYMMNGLLLTHSAVIPKQVIVSQFKSHKQETLSHSRSNNLY